MTRNEMIEAGALAIMGPAEPAPGEMEGCRSLAEDILDAVEPLIRDDERRVVGQQANVVVREKDERIAALLEDRAVLRAEVQALLAKAEADPHGSERSSAYATVLHLIDEETK